MSSYFSHPEVLLQEHLGRVAARASSSQPRHDHDLAACYREAAELVSVLHDLGKLNLNFQDMICWVAQSGSKDGFPTSYTNHSELGCLVTEFLLRQPSRLLPRTTAYFGASACRHILFHLVLRHHGNLLNLEALLSLRRLRREQIDDARAGTTPLAGFWKYLDNNDFHAEPFLQAHFPHLLTDGMSLPVRWDYYQYHRAYAVDLEERGPLADLSDHKRRELLQWQQYVFGSLVEADKLDAKALGLTGWRPLAATEQDTLRDAMRRKVLEYAQAPPPAQDWARRLNEQRSLLRHQLLEQLEAQVVEGGARVFTLPAATGAGKTMLLQEAAVWLQQRTREREQVKLGIIYALPFLSLTQQVEQLLSDGLNVDILVATSSASDQLTNEEYDCLVTGARVLDWTRTTFDQAYVVTTFVQLLESLLSHQNQRLLKLPNLSNRIFLLDEIQAIPPTLLSFLVAWLDSFVKLHGGYVILGTATMPVLTLSHPLRPFFPDYTPPKSLLNYEQAVLAPVFNRYRVVPRTDIQQQDQALALLREQPRNGLLIVNKVATARQLYDLLRLSEPSSACFLLHSRFTPVDRKEVLRKVHAALRQEDRRVFVVTTQVVEAGVDLDFDVVIRDMCPYPNLIQSAGRCNRNGRIPQGLVYLIQLQDKLGTQAEMIYDTSQLSFTMNYILNSTLGQELTERVLYELHGTYAELHASGYANANADIAKMLREVQAEALGQITLLPKGEEGKEFTFFVDTAAPGLWEEVKQELFSPEPAVRKQAVRRLATYCVQARGEAYAGLATGDSIGGIVRMLNPNLRHYHPDTGLVLL